MGISSQMPNQINSLRVLGNLCSYTSKEVQIAIDCGLLQLIKSELSMQDDKVFSMCLWIISNVAASSQEHVQLLIQSEIVIGLLQLANDVSSEKTRLILWSLLNITKAANAEQIRYLANNGFIMKLSELLQQSDKIKIRLLKAVIGSVFAIIKCCISYNYKDILVAIESCGILKVINQLEEHEDNEVYQAAYGVMELYIKFNGLDQRI